jgi:hypothetical protein
MIQAQAAADQVQASVNVIYRPLQPVPNLLRGLVVQEAELRFSGENRVDRAQEPIEIEMIAALGPLLERFLHLGARIRPLCADLRQSEVAFREFCPPAIHLVEDVHNDVQRLACASDFFNVKVDIDDAQQLGEAPDVHAQFVRGSLLAEPGYELAHASVALLHQLGDVDPQGVAFHLERLVESERLALQMESEPGEGRSGAVEELRRLSTDDTVE